MKPTSILYYANEFRDRYAYKEMYDGKENTGYLEVKMQGIAYTVT